MKKLARFTLLAIFFVILFVIFYAAIPCITAIFGGEFLAVAQHPMYFLFGGIPIIVLLGIVFNHCFDENFYSKD